MGLFKINQCSHHWSAPSWPFNHQPAADPGGPGLRKPKALLCCRCVASWITFRQNAGWIIKNYRVLTMFLFKNNNVLYGLIWDFKRYQISYIYNYIYIYVYTHLLGMYNSWIPTGQFVTVLDGLFTSRIYLRKNVVMRSSSQTVKQNPPRSDWGKYWSI